MDVRTNDEQWAHAVKHLWGLDGEPIGRAHTNPLFDTREYKGKITAGSHKKYQANAIVENMFA